MKRNTIFVIALLAVLVAVVTGLAARYLSTVVADWQCGEVYKRYKHAEGIRATYVKNFRVNDTLLVAVTLLETDDPEVWEQMMDTFHVSADAREMISSLPSEQEDVVVTMRYGLKGRPEEKLAPGEWNGAQQEFNLDFVAISFNPHVIAIFDIKSLQEGLALTSYSADMSTNKPNKYARKRSYGISNG